LSNYISYHFLKSFRKIILDTKSSKVSLRKKDALLIFCIGIRKKNLLSDSEFVQESFADSVSKLETEGGMNVEAGPEIKLKKDKQLLFVLFFYVGLVDELSFLCDNLFPRVPSINDVIEVDFVEDMVMTIFFVEIVEFLYFLLGHLFFV
jgi:hypothetical protein